ncbi:phage Gp37/Gp68 family protein [bacterium]|nr:phage Gp37/Gp68 family protein [bacterium]
MGKNSKIEWTDHTWNPWQGCKKVSTGCENCYMFRDKKRYGQDPDIVIRSKPATFNKPLHWKEPAKIFVCSWSDFFIEEADNWRDDAWDIIRRCPHLTFQILTKRPERIEDCLPDDWGEGWGNVWLGVTAENQEMADLRIPPLLFIPAAKRFVSCEPLLGPINLDQLNTFTNIPEFVNSLLALDWVIVGGESGPTCRLMEPAWARSIRDQCKANRVAFFMKQMSGKSKSAREVIPGSLLIREFPDE